MYSEKQRQWFKNRRETDPEFREYHKRLNRESYLRHKESRDLRAKNYQRQVKRDVINHYSNETNECACCKTAGIQFLTIDHINGDGAEMRKSGKHKAGSMFYVWLRKNEYPDGFQVLCFNCNHAKRQLPQCPHKELLDQPQQ